jgi:hypothetical protein
MALLISAAFSPAQDTPRADLAISYSHFEVLKGYTINMNGGAGSFAYNFNRWLGLATDIGIYHGYPAQSLTGETFTLGPRFTYRRSARLQPFAHAFFGGSHFNASSGGISGGGFPLAWGLGAGLDFPVGAGKKFAIRLADDDFGTRSGGATRISNRLSAGFAFRFGQK